MWNVSSELIIFILLNLVGFVGAFAIVKLAQVRFEAEELSRQSEQIERASKAHTQFLATMSHEIRTPINGIVGLSTILNETALNDEQKKILDMIRSSADSLLSLINDILDYSKIEAGKMEIAPTVFNLKKEMKNLVETMALLAERKNLKITLDFDPTIENSLYGDINRIKQIIINLIGNSIKFTDRGSINIKVSQLRLGKRRSHLRFSITDTGIGISAEKIGKLFIPYSQTHTGQKAFGGSGLGLYICKNLVEKMNGKIGVFSSPNQGSEFWFELKIQNSKNFIDVTVPRESSPSSKFFGRVLLAEDNKVNQIVTETFLKKVGIQVISVENGQELLNYLEKDSEFDLILMDCQMPILDGYRTTEWIRKSERHYSQIPIIALSASVMQDEQVQCYKVGMDDFISKPVSLENLTSKIKPWLKKIAA